MIKPLFISLETERGATVSCLWISTLYMLLSEAVLSFCSPFSTKAHSVEITYNYFSKIGSTHESPTQRSHPYLSFSE